MADVFISYSRLDKDFVGKLREALIAQQQEVWIDWESIPPSQAWWSEIQKGIARANNFVVVLSPASMASPICQMEIEYARQLHKRIIPVLHADYERATAITSMAERLAKKEETSTREIWGNRQPHDVFDANDAELKHINYFFFKAEADFPARFADLFSIIRTDYRHKEQHTTLELRALEWDRRGRDASFLLIENELKEAQDWLAQAPGKDPAPTDLHTAYIAASAKRTRQLRTIRRTSVIGSAVAVIAILFAVGASVIGTRAVGEANVAGTQVAGANAQLGTATVQQGAAEQIAAQAVLEVTQANQQLATAVVQEVTAVSIVNISTTQVANANTQLTHIPPTLNAASTQLQEAGNRITSLNLAAEALEILNESSFSSELTVLLGIRALQIAYTQQADAILVSATDRLDNRSLYGHAGSMTSTTYSPNGRFIIASSGNLDDNLENAVRVWDATNRNLLHILLGHTDWVNSAAYSPDGRFIVTSSRDGTARIWNALTGDEIRSLTGHTDWVNSAVYSPDGRLIVTSSRDGTARIWNALTGDEIRSLIGHTSEVTSATYSPDGHFIATSSHDGTARIWDVLTGDEIRSLVGHTNWVNSVAFSPDGHFIVTSSNDASARIWDAFTGAEIHRLLGHTNNVTDAEYSPDGKNLTTSSADETARVWDAVTGLEIRVISGHISWVASASYSPDGDFIVTSSWDNTVRISYVDYYDFIAYACTLIFRDFTVTERQRYRIDDTPTCEHFGPLPTAGA